MSSSHRISAFALNLAMGSVSFELLETSGGSLPWPSAFLRRSRRPSALASTLAAKSRQASFHMSGMLSFAFSVSKSRGGSLCTHPVCAVHAVRVLRQGAANFACVPNMLEAAVPFANLCHDTFARGKVGADCVAAREGVAVLRKRIVSIDVIVTRE